MVDAVQPRAAATDEVNSRIQTQAFQTLMQAFGPNSPTDPLKLSGLDPTNPQKNTKADQGTNFDNPNANYDPITDGQDGVA